MMKKRIFILILLVAFLFVGCSEEVVVENYDQHTEQSQISEQTEEKEQEEEQEEEEQKEEEEEPSEEDDGLYNIFYDKETGVFSSDCPYVVFIEKDPTKDFVILNLTDVQLSTIERSSLLPGKNRFEKTADYLIKTVKPDLITYTGDFGDYLDLTDSLEYLAGFIDSYDIPWAPVFGNHDNESSDMLLKAEKLEGYENCLFKTGPTDLAEITNLLGVKGDVNVGNYVVNIVEKADNKKGYVLVNSLIFMNTGNYRYLSATEISTYHANEKQYNGSNWSSLSDKQIEWYEWVVKSAKKANKNVKSSLFVHIPIYAYSKACNAAIKGAPDIYTNTSDFEKYAAKITYQESCTPNVWNEGYESSTGVLHELLGCPGYDDFVFDKIKELGSTNFVICGHDHKNNFAIIYEGVQLVYGTKTGSGCYWEEGLSGGTVITIDESSTEIKHMLYSVK